MSDIRRQKPPLICSLIGGWSNKALSSRIAFVSRICFVSPFFPIRGRDSDWLEDFCSDGPRGSSGVGYCASSWLIAVFSVDGSFLRWGSFVWPRLQVSPVSVGNEVVAAQCVFFHAFKACGFSSSLGSSL